MVVLLDAWNQRGWSHCDHLINDEPLKQLVGQCYRSPSVMRRALERRESRWTQAITAIYRDDQGRRWQLDTSGYFEIPGRDVAPITELETCTY
jgi:hypothetical protein